MMIDAALQLLGNRAWPGRARRVGTQSQNREAAALFVLCADTRRHQLIAAAEGQPYSANFETFLLGVIDASLFVERMSAALEALGYGICYVGAVKTRSSSCPCPATHTGTQPCPLRCRLHTLSSKRHGDWPCGVGGLVPWWAAAPKPAANGGQAARVADRRLPAVRTVRRGPGRPSDLELEGG